mgnify:CR=1 FL=1
MKNFRCYFIIMVFFLLANSLFGQSGNEIALNSSRQAELRFNMMGKESFFKNEWNLVKSQVESDAGRKKTGIGILLSAVIPGAGELYAGSIAKGVIFLGTEIALWVGYWKFSDQGQKWQDIFQDFADTHWNEKEWRNWMQAHPEFGDTTHTLPSGKTQQYYEMIGKYDEFKAGWDDYKDGEPALTPHRDYYENLRNRSNIEFKRASYCVMISLGNRVLSAFDTAITIRGLNHRVKTAMRMGMKRGINGQVPILALRVKW